MQGQFVTFTAPNAVTMSMVDLQEPVEGEILIEAEASLISSGTERQFLRQAFYYPFYPGYSLVGRVLKVGPGVTAFAIGDRVVASAPHGSHVVCDARMAFKVPDGVEPAQAAFMTVGAMAVHAVRLARISMGDPVLMIGQGLIGLIAAQVARLQGALPVIGVDLDADRLKLSATLGTDHAVDPRDEDGLSSLVRSLPGEGVAACIELSGVSDMIERAVELTRRRGRIVAASIVPGGHKTDLFGLVSFKGLELVGAYFNARPWRLNSLDLTSPGDWPVRLRPEAMFEGNDIGTSASDNIIFLRMVQLKRVAVDPLITDVAGPGDAPGLFEKLNRGELLGGIIKWR